MATTATATQQVQPDFRSAEGTPAWRMVFRRLRAVVGTTLVIVGEELCEALDIRAGQSVLDVAAGNGNATLAAARRWCDVVSTDYVPGLLARGKLRAQADGMKSDPGKSSAEALSFGDGAFDVVVSTFGVMFTPNQDRAAAELVRVCRPGGKIGLANWTPEGFIGQLFKTLGKYLPPPAGAKLAGCLGHARARIEGDVRVRPPRAPSMPSGGISTSVTGRPSTSWRYSRTITVRCSRPSPQLDANNQQKLHQDLTALIGTMNRAEDGTMIVPSEYSEIVIVKR